VQGSGGSWIDSKFRLASIANGPPGGLATKAVHGAI